MTKIAQLRGGRGVMFRWLYRTLFARRATWVLEKQTDGGETSTFRLTCYDPDESDLEYGHNLALEMLADDWVLVSRPRE